MGLCRHMDCIGFPVGKCQLTSFRSQRLYGSCILRIDTGHRTSTHILIGTGQLSYYEVQLASSHILTSKAPGLLGHRPRCTGAGLYGSLCQLLTWYMFPILVDARCHCVGGGVLYTSTLIYRRLYELF